MEISFILTTSNNDNPENLANFLTKIFATKQKDFEIVIIDNYFYDNLALKVINHFFNLYPGQIQVISNYKPLDIATSRNLGIRCANGNYLAFLNTSDIIQPQYFKKVFVVLKKYPQVSCLEYGVFDNWEPNQEHSTLIRLKPKILYQLNEDNAKAVYAMTAPLLSTKLFSKKVIEEHKLIFRKPLQFNSYFIYAFLAHAETFVALNECLIINQNSTIYHDNSFDLINQWIHILNYYNNLGLKKKYSDELEYASLRYMLYNFLWAISNTKNKPLIQKVYEHIKEIIIKRHKNFRKNPYLTINKVENDSFLKVINNFDQYMKDFLKNNQIQDDDWVKLLVHWAKVKNLINYI